MHDWVLFSCSQLSVPPSPQPSFQRRKGIVTLDKHVSSSYHKQKWNFQNDLTAARVCLQHQSINRNRLKFSCFNCLKLALLPRSILFTSIVHKTPLNVHMFVMRKQNRTQVTKRRISWKVCRILALQRNIGTILVLLKQREKHFFLQKKRSVIYR